MPIREILSIFNFMTKLLNILGLMSVILFIVFLFLASSPIKLSSTESSNLSRAIGWTAGISVILFSLSAIIKAVNENTEELKKIRYTISKGQLKE
jgi:preprotein translocase subunit YajC